MREGLRQQQILLSRKFELGIIKESLLVRDIAKAIAKCHENYLSSNT